MLLLLFGGIFTVTYIQKTTNNRKLDIILTAIDANNYANKLFATNQEKTEILENLQFFSKTIDSIAYKDSIYSYLVGHDARMQRTLSNASKALKEQIKRYENLNDLLSESGLYHKEEYDSINIRLIEPNTLGLDILNIALILKSALIKPSKLYIQILEKHSEHPKTLYSQYYKYQSGINSFLLPNYKNHNFIIKLGYIESKNDTLIYKYQIYEKHASTEL